MSKSRPKSKGMGIWLGVAAGLAIAGAPGAKSAPKVPSADLASSSDSNVALGKRMAAQRGWTGSQWGCLDALWEKESRWSADAVETAYTGPGTPTYAYGIPQANPADFGHPYPLGDARPQIAWGLRYIADRYGTPCSAWSHEESDNWY
jgi:resuscitation-promoting factor RpfB